MGFNSGFKGLTSSVRHVKRRSWYPRFNSANSHKHSPICKTGRKFESQSSVSTIVVSKISKHVLSFTWNFIHSLWWPVLAFAQQANNERDLGSEWVRNCRRVDAWEGGSFNSRGKSVSAHDKMQLRLDSSTFREPAVRELVNSFRLKVPAIRGKNSLYLKGNVTCDTWGSRGVADEISSLQGNDDM
jgi:hypothetical protein